MAEPKKHVELTDEHHDLLHRIARRRGESLSQVVHEALDLFLTEVVPDPDETAEADATSEARGSEQDDPAEPAGGGDPLL